jgi:hypothetical protein
VKARVTFRAIDERLASTRLRALIPQRELMMLGVEPGRDVLVIGKHGWNWDDEARDYKRVVFDVCDDHFDSVGCGAFYRDACARADALTCNSHAMRRRIKEVTGRDAWMIPDPWEGPEAAPRVHDALLWFGHKSNLPDLGPHAERLAGRRLTVVSNIGGDPGVAGWTGVQWSLEAMERQFAAAGLVVIPTGKSACKSGNRAIESIRRGLYPVCGPLPAYADLGVWVGDIGDGVEWALSHHDEVMQRLRAAQSYVRWQYCPARIAKLWLECLAYV